MQITRMASRLPPFIRTYSEELGPRQLQMVMTVLATEIGEMQNDFHILMNETQNLRERVAKLEAENECLRRNNCRMEAMIVRKLT